MMFSMQLMQVRILHFKSHNLMNLPIQNQILHCFYFGKKFIHATHFLKLFDKICKYKMDPASIVEDTEETPFCPQMHRRTRWNQYTPSSREYDYYINTSNWSWCQASVYVALLWNIICWICILKPLFVTSLWPNLTLLCNTGSTYTDN